MSQSPPVQQEPRGGAELGVYPERCVHSLFEQAGCSACAAVCPMSAWSFDDDGLNLDSASCDNCGLCAAACPQEALSVHLNLLSVEMEDQRWVLAACDRAAVAPGDGVIPCVHSLSARALARLAAEGIGGIATVSGDCGNCDRGNGKRLEQRLTELNHLLRSRGLAEFVHREKACAAWQALRAPAGQTSGHSMDRRRFLRRGLRELTRLAHGLGEAEPDAAPRPASALLGGGGDGIAEWRPLFDEQACDGCSACIRLCPTHALEFDDTHHRYQVFPDLCTGCRVCGDVCEANAITPAPWAEATPYTVRLEERRCGSCGVTFRLPVARADTENLCQICRKTNHYRHLFQVLSP